MKIKNIYYSPYRNSLKQSFYNAKNKYSYKEGLIVELHSSNSMIGYGEASPLIGFSKETIKEINWGIESFIAAIELNYNYSLDELLNLVEIHCHNLSSLHFALDTAIYDLVGKIQKRPICKILNKESAQVIEFSNIYMPNNNTQPNENNIMKYKLGVNTTNQDIEILNTLIENNPSVKFRFDANRCYDKEDFIRIIHQLKKFKIDYFEEPLKKLSKYALIQIKNKLSVKIAIDESLYDGTNYVSWIENNLIDTVIIKPSIFGSYKKNFELFEKCKRYNINLILSSALENSIGNMATIHLAASINNKLAHGLNIHNFYNDFMYTPIYKENDSSINISKLIGLGI